MYLRQTKVLGLALLVGGLAVASAGLRLLVSSNQYQATALINADSDDPFRQAPSLAYVEGPTNFAAVEADMRSEAVLTNVVFELKLDALWGVKYGNGKKLTLSDTVNRLRDRLSLKPFRRTKLIAVTSTSEDPLEAARLANITASAYHDFRLRQAEQAVLTPIIVLEDRFQRQEANMVAARSNVNALAIKCGVVAPASGTGEARIKVGADRLSNEQIRQYESGKSYLELSTTLGLLRGLNRDKLREVLLGMNPDETYSSLMDRLHESAAQYVQLTNEYAITNPAVIRAKSAMDKLNEQIDIRAAGWLAGMETKVALQKAETERFRKEVEVEIQSQQAYLEAKQQLDRLMDEHHLLGEQIKTEKEHIMLPPQNVAIADYAEPSFYPIGTVRPLGALLLGVALFPILAGWLLVKSR